MVYMSYDGEVPVYQLLDLKFRGRLANRMRSGGNSIMSTVRFFVKGTSLLLADVTAPVLLKGRLAGSRADIDSRGMRELLIA